MILDADLSQIEWRTAADLSKDPIMMAEVQAGVDQHAATCTDLMELPLTKDNRSDAKIFNFRYIYCEPRNAPFAYSMDSKMPNFPKKKWEDIIERMVTKYSGLAAWHQELIRTVRKTGVIHGPLGHIWTFTKEQKRGYWDYNTHQIRNYPVQGTSGAIIKLALVIIQKRAAHLKRKKFIMTVHDSLIWDAHPDEVEELGIINLQVFQEIPDLVKKYFGYQIEVPITGEAEFGPSWGNMTEEISI